MEAPLDAPVVVGSSTEAVTPGARLRCVRRSAVRQSEHLYSDRVGFLEAGSEITALDVQASDALDSMRVRYLQGWVSTRSASGAVLLEPVATPQSAAPPVPGLDLDAEDGGTTADISAEQGSTGALDELLGTMRQMETVLTGGGGGGGSGSRPPRRHEAMEEASRLLSEASYTEAAEAFNSMLARDPGDESAQRGLRQAEKGLQLTQQMELEEWLAGLGLQHFAWSMVEQGFVSLRQLQELSDDELRAAHAAVGMAGDDAKTLMMALRGTGVPGTPGGCEDTSAGLGGLLAAAPPLAGPKELSPSSAKGPPRGLLSRAQSTSSTPIRSWTSTWQLADSVELQLQQLGVETVGDLQALDADDIADVRRPLKKVQSKKFVQALAQALDDIEREMVEQELNRAHEEAGRLRREHAASLMGRAAAPPTPTRRGDDADADAAGDVVSGSSGSDGEECVAAAGSWGAPPVPAS